MKRQIIIGASCVVAIGIVVGAIIFTTKSSADNATGTQEFTVQQLSAFNGKNGKACYVAVDTKVYMIEQGRLWQDGNHTTAAGQAHCGQDLTEAISKSPHGRTKLTSLEVKGTLAK